MFKRLPVQSSAGAPRNGVPAVKGRAYIALYGDTAFLCLHVAHFNWLIGFHVTFQVSDEVVIFRYRRDSLTVFES